MTSQHAFGAMTLKGGICALLHARVAAAGSCRATSQQIVPAQTPTFGGTCLRAFQRAAPLPMNPWKLANGSWEHCCGRASRAYLATAYTPIIWTESGGPTCPRCSRL